MFTKHPFIKMCSDCAELLGLDEIPRYNSGPGYTLGVPNKEDDYVILGFHKRKFYKLPLDISKNHLYYWILAIYLEELGG